MLLMFRRRGLHDDNSFVYTLSIRAVVDSGHDIAKQHANEGHLHRRGCTIDDKVVRVVREIRPAFAQPVGQSATSTRSEIA